jgi:DNA polymerase-2
MIRHNVTPEAVNCVCCPDNKAPEIGHHLCRRKTGMVPQVLRPLVDKRIAYKRLIKAGHPDKASFKARYDAIKWALVTCFGYLGFRNARFGRIEAHECVNAYSREALLTAKEVAEARGFHFVHAIVDSLWLKKPGASDPEIERLRLDIEIATGLPVGLEGRTRWVRLCSSREDNRVGVPNRYFCVFDNGEVKVRGIELRRRDTPLFIKEFQERCLSLMGGAADVASLRALKNPLENLRRDFKERLRRGRVCAPDLALTVQLSQEPADYLHDTLSALAAKKLAASGVELHPGETVQYVVAEEKSRVKDWRVMPLAFIEDAFEFDRGYYDRLLDRAWLTLTEGLWPEDPPAAAPKVKKTKTSDRQLAFDF